MGGFIIATLGPLGPQGGFIIATGRAPWAPLGPGWNNKPPLYPLEGQGCNNKPPCFGLAGLPVVPSLGLVWPGPVLPALPALPGLPALPWIVPATTTAMGGRGGRE